MFDATWLNVGSLLLGLAALVLPFGYMKTKQVAFLIASMGACAAAVCLQLFYQQHLAEIGDWSAVADTTGAAAKVSATLVVLTVGLNMSMLAVRRHKIV